MCRMLIQCLLSTCSNVKQRWFMGAECSRHNKHLQPWVHNFSSASINNFTWSSLSVSIHIQGQLLHRCWCRIFHLHAAFLAHGTKTGESGGAGKWHHDSYKSFNSFYYHMWRWKQQTSKNINPFHTFKSPMKSKISTLIKCICDVACIEYCICILALSLSFKIICKKFV